MDPAEPSFVSVRTTSFATSSTPAIGIMATHVPKSISDTSTVVMALVSVMDALTVSVCANELLVMAKPSDTALANANNLRVLLLIRFLLVFPRFKILLLSQIVG